MERNSPSTGRPSKARSIVIAENAARFGIGSLIISARRSGARTVIERVRYDGLLRCSRAFAHGDAALIVLSQLGPGVVRGDSVTTRGSVAAGAHLIVTSQTATRVMGGGREARAESHWSVAAGGTLELAGEPLVASPDARYTVSTSVDLAPGAIVALSEIAWAPAAAAVRVRTLVRCGDRELLYDALEAGTAAPQAVGTFALVGIARSRITPLTSALDDAGDANAAVRCGVGKLDDGVFVRVLAADIWTVRSALERLRECAREAGLR